MFLKIKCKNVNNDFDLKIIIIKRNNIKNNIDAQIIIIKGKNKINNWIDLFFLIIIKISIIILIYKLK